AAAPAPAAAPGPDLAASSAATSRLISEIAAARAAPASRTAAAAAPSTPPSGAAQPAEGRVAAAPAPALPTPGTAGLRPLVIAIDAGHGGQDPGAVGPTGKREKDITLAIARELARQVDATPGLRSFLTRDR